METIGEAIQRCRLSVRLSQDAAARKAGVPVPSLRKWERDAACPLASSLFQLAAGWDLPVEDFLPRKRTKGPKPHRWYEAIGQGEPLGKE